MIQMIQMISDDPNDPNDPDDQKLSFFEISEKVPMSAFECHFIRSSAVVLWLRRNSF